MVRFRVGLGLGLGLGLNADIQNGTIMSINEDPSPNLIGRQVDHLYILAILICRLVDLSTCRPIALVNNKDPVRVRVKLGLGLGLVCG